MNAPTNVRSLSQASLLDSNKVGLDQMPRLQIVFDRMAQQLIEGIRQLSAQAPYVSLSGIETERIGDVLDSYEANALVAVLYCKEWDSRLLIGFDRDFLFSMTDVLLGADGTEPPFDEDRSFTTIEMRLARMLFQEAVTAFQNAFGQLGSMTIMIERVEGRMDFALVGRRNNPCIVCRMMLQALGRGGELFVVLPQGCLNAVRESLAQVNSGVTASNDKRWSRNLTEELQRSKVRVSVVLEDFRMPLADIASLKVGQLLPLTATPRSKVRLECNKQPLFMCRLGQTEGSYSVQIEESVDAMEENLNHALNALF